MINRSYLSSVCNLQLPAMSLSIDHTFILASEHPRRTMVMCWLPHFHEVISLFSLVISPQSHILVECSSKTTLPHLYHVFLLCMERLSHVYHCIGPEYFITLL